MATTALQAFEQFKTRLTLTSKQREALRERRERVRTLLWLGVPATVAAAAAAASIITDWSSVAAGILALIAALLAAVQTFIAPERRATEHKQLGVAYRQLQADARVFRTIDYEDLDPNARRMRLDDLLRRRAELNARNRPNERAFKKARKKIESGDLSYDAEPPVPPAPSTG